MRAISGKDSTISDLIRPWQATAEIHPEDVFSVDEHEPATHAVTLLTLRSAAIDAVISLPRDDIGRLGATTITERLVTHAAERTTTDTRSPKLVTGANDSVEDVVIVPAIYGHG